MSSVKYRVERNPLTKPESYRLRFMPQWVAGSNEIASELSERTGMTQEQSVSCLKSLVEIFRHLLANGVQITLEEVLTLRPSLHARLTTPDEPLPPIEDLLRLNASISRPFTQSVQQQVELERVPWKEKVPSILSATDTRLRLNNVLNPEGVLRLSGSNLFFNWEADNVNCTIAGTQSGSIVQRQFADITDREVLVVPNIPAQANPWNNEYTISITTQYTQHGSTRTGVYGHKLRTPILVPGLSADPTPETGILTDNAASAYVSINGGELTADTRLRIAVEYDQANNHLIFRLLAIQDGAGQGTITPVTENGEYLLPGFTGSPLGSLDLTVNDYASLKTMVQENYDGRLVDILDLRMAEEESP